MTKFGKVPFTIEKGFFSMAPCWLMQIFQIFEFCSAKVPRLKEVNFGKVKLWDVEHFPTDFDLRKGRDKKMDQIFD